MSRKEMDVLLNDGIETATRFLRLSGEFFPFAVGLSSNGEIRHIQGSLEEEKPLSERVVELLRNGINRAVQKGEYFAVALITDIKLQEPGAGKETDAIKVDIEHRKLDPVTCYLPYQIAENGEVHTGKIVSVPGDSLFFKK